MRIIRTQDRIPLPQKAAEKAADDAARGYRPETLHEADRGKSGEEGGNRDD
jgi:hypothetical protein